MNRNGDHDGLPQPPAMILRSGLRRARLDELGGEPLTGSGFEGELPEPDFTESE